MSGVGKDFFSNRIQVGQSNVFHRHTMELKALVVERQHVSYLSLYSMYINQEEGVLC